jgi:phosphohistidine phosphatase SixA
MAPATCPPPSSAAHEVQPAYRGRSRRRLTALLAVTAIAAVGLVAPPAAAGPADARSRRPAGGPADRVVILVRHAEVLADAGRDPGLSPAGDARAQALADALADEHPALIIVSDTQRSRQTAAALAARSGTRVRVVDVAGGGLQTHVAAVIAAIPVYTVGPIVVVGHSNTLPLIAAALGAPAQPDLAHDCYDVLWRLTRPRQAHAAVRFEAGHYGAPSPACASGTSASGSVLEK